MSETNEARQPKTASDGGFLSDRHRTILAFLAAITAVLTAFGGVLQWIVPLFGNGGSPPAAPMNIVNTIHLPAGLPMPAAGAVSQSVPADVVAPRAAVAPPEAMRPPAPADPHRVVPVVPRVRSVASGVAFALCDVESFQVTPWQPMAGRPRQAALRTSSAVPHHQGGGLFERVLTVGLEQELWPGCRVTLVVVEDGPLAAVSLREQFSGQSAQ